MTKLKTDTHLLQTTVTGSSGLFITNEDNMLLMSRYPDNYFDLAIVDPPYGININESMGRRKGDKHSGREKTYWDSSIPDESYFKELFRVSKEQIVWGGNYMTKYLAPSSCWLLWDKGFSEDVTFAQYEMAWTSFTSSAKKYDKHPNQLNRIHPTQKPIQLYSWVLQRFAKPDYKIIDTHLGSGSIAIAVDNANKMDKMNLTLVACERDKKHYKDAVTRINNETNWQSLF